MGNEKDEILVEFKDVVKTYGTGDGMQKAVDHISFSICEGEFVVILGQSGAGKSYKPALLHRRRSVSSGGYIRDLAYEYIRRASGYPRRR